LQNGIYILVDVILDISGTRDGYLVLEDAIVNIGPSSAHRRDKIARRVTRDWLLSDRRHKILYTVILVTTKVRTYDCYNFQWRNKDQQPF